MSNSHQVAFAFTLSCFFCQLNVTGLILTVFIHVNLCIHSSFLSYTHEKVYFSLQIIHVRQTNPSITERGVWVRGKKSCSNAKGIFTWECLGFLLFITVGKNTLINCFIEVFWFKYILSCFLYSFGTFLLLSQMEYTQDFLW